MFRERSRAAVEVPPDTLSGMKIDDAGRRPARRRLATIGLGLAFVCGATACSSGSSDVARDGGGTGADSEGAQVYQESCASCHGSDLRGTDRGPSQLSVVYEPNHHSDASYRAAIVDGVVAHHWGFGDMPPIDGLDDAQIDAVIAYIRTQQDEHGFEAYPPD